MNTMLYQQYKWTIILLQLLICLILGLSLSVSPIVSTVQADGGLKLSNEYYIDTFDDDGEEIDLILVPGGPSEDAAPTAELPKRGASGSNIIPYVPAFDWCYGCSATSAAILFGYYDNQGYDNMYTGPTNDGDCPMTNSVWGSGECPLSATHQGLDGLKTKGHVDDYWSSLGSSSDPYYNNWDESGYADCTADFMGTNQYNNWNTSDGGTFFFFRGDGSPLYDYSTCEPSYRDGSHGMRLFAESRGYDVETNFSQYIKGVGSNPDNGFSFSDFQAEIDSGRPVIIQVAGHSMLGFGYSEPDTVYLHNTWDHNDHSMTWGESYYGMQHYGVTVLRLESTEPAPPPEPEFPTASTLHASSIEQHSAILNGIIDNDGGESCQVRFEYDIDPDEPYTFNTDWSGNLNTGDDFNQVISSLNPNTTYYFRAQTKNSAASFSGIELSFTSLSVVLPEAPLTFSAEASGSQQINLSWTMAADADKTKIQRKQGSFPVDKNDGTELYFGNAETFSDTELTPETSYYYRAWSFSEDSTLWSENYAESQAITAKLILPPTTSTVVASSIEQHSAILNGTIDNDGGESCQVRFEYDIDPDEPYTFNTDWSGNLNTGDDFNQVISSLNPNTTYYFRAQTKNSAASFSGIELSFTSLSVVLPEAPLTFSAEASGSQQINLSWTMAADADKTKIQRKQGSFPVDKNDGTELYFGNAETFSDTELTPETSYYYRAWSFSEDSTLWSENYAESQAATEVLPNNPPNVATNPSPETLTGNVSINAVLNWYGDDPDEGDSLTYDIYFDTVDASTLVSSNQPSTSFEPGELENDSSYLWKVIASDSHGMRVEGPVWEFNTEPAESTLLTSYDINLSAGWNLISLPLIPESSDINDIINSDNLASGNVNNIDIVYHYNTSSESWDYWREKTGGTLQSIKDGNGYWVYTKTADVLTTHGLEAATAGYTLQSNWNMLGFTSIEEQNYDTYLASVGEAYSVLYGWDAATGSWYCPTVNQNGGKLEPGHGYWVHMSAPGTITLS